MTSRIAPLHFARADIDAALRDLDAAAPIERAIALLQQELAARRLAAKREAA